jgi:hypothetical protein
MEAMKAWDEMEAMELNAEECEDTNPETYDGKAGEMLYTELVAKARAGELTLMRKIKLFDEAPASKCWQRAGRPQVSAKCADVSKVTAEKPDVRCRLVARDCQPEGEKDREDLFAAVPPLEAKRWLFDMAAADSGGTEGGPGRSSC